MKRSSVGSPWFSMSMLDLVASRCFGLDGFVGNIMLWVVIRELL